ncbi:MAG: HPP family protein [Candidatus Kentron sp. G]|nr:MAG: HPP family protein [Candidatus Kentron sp. G]VFN06296.1 MAG: HPP family protein [Candidatus Kentron sp. G]VFN07858.1 MAG: HPP family protein [Candidatus Kentron sp. G]
MEKLICALGGFLAILVVIWITRHFVPSGGVALVVASMGASAVLLFVVPASPFSQPWPLLAGHLIPGTIGVTCGMLIPDLMLASAITVSATILVMQYLRCIHPPGGATALTAVIGGPDIHALGYQFLLTPVGINVVIMLGMAILVNYWFPWRRYPAGLKSHG